MALSSEWAKATVELLGEMEGGQGTAVLVRGGEVSRKDADRGR